MNAQQATDNEALRCGRCMMGLWPGDLFYPTDDRLITSGQTHHFVLHPFRLDKGCLILRLSEEPVNTQPKERKRVWRVFAITAGWAIRSVTSISRPFKTQRGGQNKLKAFVEQLETSS